MTLLEAAMLKAIQPHLQHRFIPYIQLHEFEGLLFCDMAVFTQQISPDELTNMDELENTIIAFPNPELINNNRNTAPSKRLEKLIYGYTKTVYGPILAAAIGLQKIRNKCPRFNGWITTLEQI